jgi:hypothetical protein
MLRALGSVERKIFFDPLQATIQMIIIDASTSLFHILETLRKTHSLVLNSEFSKSELKRSYPAGVCFHG